MELYLYLGTYILFIVGVSIFFGRKNTKEDFLIAGRNRGWFQISASKFAAHAGMAWFISLTAYAYQYGFSTVYLLISIIISYLLFSFWAVPRIYKESKEKRLYTQGDYIESKTQSKITKKIADYILVIQTFISYIISIVGGAKTIEFLDIMPYEYAVILTSTIVLIYILIAGFRVVILTDVIQAFVILFLLFVVLFNLPDSFSISKMLEVEIQTMSAGLAVGFFIYGVFSLFSSPDRFMLVFAAKEYKQARKGMAIGVIPVLMTMFVLILIGIFIYSQNPSLDPDLAFLDIFNYLPETLISLASVMIFAGLMSSADTNIYVMSSFISMINGKGENSVKKIRTVSCLVVLVGIIFSLVFTSVLNITIFAAGFTLIIPVAVIYIIAGGKNSEKFIASIVFAAIFLAIGIYIFGLEPTIAIFPILGGALGLLMPLKFLQKFYR